MWIVFLFQAVMWYSRCHLSYEKGVTIYVEIVVRVDVRIGGECDIGCLTGIRCGINEVITMEAKAITSYL